jgi:hypothetical protein
LITRFATTSLGFHGTSGGGFDGGFYFLLVETFTSFSSDLVCSLITNAWAEVTDTIFT